MSEDAFSQGAFVETLLERVPELELEVRDHLEYHDGLLLHLLMADLLRAALRLFHAGELEVEQRLLDFIDLALRRGDAAVENAVQVSFVEDAGAFAEETPGFIASWPAGLKADLDRSRQKT